MGGTAGIGGGHLKANAYVQTFQNPFGDFLKQTVDPLNAASKAGTLTYDQAKAALDSFNNQWTAFDTASQQFSAMGGDYAKVVKQAYDPNKDFMKTVTGVRSTLQQYVDQLKPTAANPNDPTKDATTPPDPNNPTGTGGQTATSAARSAAVALARRNAAGTGFMSTILGGSMNNTMTQRKTLLGY